MRLWKNEDNEFVWRNNRQHGFTEASVWEHIQALYQDDWKLNEDDKTLDMHWYNRNHYVTYEISIDNWDTVKEVYETLENSFIESIKVKNKLLPFDIGTLKVDRSKEVKKLLSQGWRLCPYSKVVYKPKFPNERNYCKKIFVAGSSMAQEIFEKDDQYYEGKLKYEEFERVAEPMHFRMRRHGAGTIEDYIKGSQVSDYDD